METLHNQILVPADTSKLSELREYLYQICERNNIASQTTRRMVLAIDEALANVIEHGGRVTSDISVSLEITQDEIVATLRDTGTPFDPTLEGGPPDRRRYPRRGFGLYLIHLIVDDIHYERTDAGENVLVLRKSINSPQD